jgi:hypothetical protein
MLQRSEIAEHPADGARDLLDREGSRDGEALAVRDGDFAVVERAACG